MDFGKVAKVTKIGTQGRYNVGQWVTKYIVSYSMDGGYFHFQLHKPYDVPRVNKHYDKQFINLFRINTTLAIDGEQSVLRQSQMETQVDASYKLASTCVSVWPRLACTCVDLRWLAFTLVEIKFARKSTQVFPRLATQRKLTQVLLFT